VLESLSILFVGFFVLGIALMVDVEKESRRTELEGAQTLLDPDIASQAKSDW